MRSRLFTIFLFVSTSTSAVAETDRTRVRLAHETHPASTLAGKYIFEERYGRVGLVKKVDPGKKTMTVEFQEPVVSGRLISTAKLDPFIKVTQEIPLSDAYLLERLPKDLLGLNLQASANRSEIVTPVFEFRDGGYLVSKTPGGRTDPLKLDLEIMGAGILALEKKQRALKPGQLLLVQPNEGFPGFTLGLFDSIYAASGRSAPYPASHVTDRVAYYPLKPVNNEAALPDVVSLLNAPGKKRLENFDTSRLRDVPSLAASVVTQINDGPNVSVIKRNTRGGPVTEGTVIGKAPSPNGKGSVFLVNVTAERVPRPPKERGVGAPWEITRNKFNDGHAMVATGDLRSTNCFFGRLGMIKGAD